MLILFVIFGIVYIWLNEQNRQQELEATGCKTIHLKNKHQRKAFAENSLSLQQKTKLLQVMALEIKAIPTLRGKEAERFVKEADKAYQKKEKTDFSKQVKMARAILKKANML